MKQSITAVTTYEECNQLLDDISAVGYEWGPQTFVAGEDDHKIEPCAGCGQDDGNWYSITKKIDESEWILCSCPDCDVFTFIFRDWSKS